MKRGHDVVHVAAARDDPGTRREDRHDAAYCAGLGRAREHDDRASAAASRRTADEVDLPANARIQVRADRVGVDLAGQIDLDRTVDADDIVVLPVTFVNRYNPGLS